MTPEYLCVLDFEATCWDDPRIKPQEIIEVPVVLYDVARRATVDTWRTYCTPVCGRVSPFCEALTGISQATVDGGVGLAEGLAAMHRWLARHGLWGADGRFRGLFVTWGSWDLATMLPASCRLLAINSPPYLHSWCNLKRTFRDVVGRKPGGLLQGLEALGVPHVGRHHSGLDDAINTTAIAAELLRRGGAVVANECLRPM